MVTTRIPADWRDLQTAVANILAQSGFSVQVEKVIQTVRGRAEIDVFGQEAVEGRTYTVLCECKNWAARVPQNVIHGFRTVIADAGANLGYIISTAGFQSGARTAAEMTNVRLVTWLEFQAEFEQSWITHHFQPTLNGRLDTLWRYTEPIPPYRLLDRLNESAQRAFVALRQTHQPFWSALFTVFSPFLRMPVPDLPLRARFRDVGDSVPAQVLDALGYQDLLEAVLDYGEATAAQFSAVIDPAQESPKKG
jgi:restriction system protein